MSLVLASKINFQLVAIHHLDACSKSETKHRIDILHSVLNIFKVNNEPCRMRSIDIILILLVFNLNTFSLKFSWLGNLESANSNILDSDFSPKIRTRKNPILDA